jgi:DNA modification methylase
MNSTLHIGNCLDILATLPNNSIQTVITSPPYYGLRSYNGGEHEIGLERTPQEYVAKLVQVFRQVRRVLKDDGTVWLNLGDSYAVNGSKNTGRNDDGRHSDTIHGHARKHARHQIERLDCLPSKNLLGIPWRVAFALQDDGWILRSDIIWSKPNPMPESVTDRPTKAHEYLFLFAKQSRYFYNADAIKVPSLHAGELHTMCSAKQSQRAVQRAYGPSGNEKPGTPPVLIKPTKNIRSVWTIATKPYKGAHFATFPPKLVEPMILAGSCSGSIVLDPFAGAGTVGMVAAQHQRHFIGIDLNAEYVQLAHCRIDPIVSQSMVSEVVAA